jgi:hypothetical protein
MRARAALVVAVSLLASCRIGFERLSADGGDGSVGGPDAVADRPNRIFVMDAASPMGANYGGIAGADATCQTRADANSLGGTWRAVLWTSAGGPSTRFAASRGWVDLTGTPIADRAIDLDARNLNPLRVSELGTPIGGAARYAFRGNTVDNCSDWTSNGSAQALAIELDGSWLNDSFLGCSDNTVELICAETGHNTSVLPIVEPGRIAFVTQAAWMPTGGLTAADAICQGEANAAGLIGDFDALLTTTTATAESRFMSSGLPWQRVDGVRITATADQLVGASSAAVWDSFIARTATNDVTDARIWYGSASANCNNWLGAAGVPQGVMGRSHLALRSMLSYFGPTSCFTSLNLICLQQ